nr:hypothetical protein B0A51_08728 [Rachicladosporium sp. CCFEE 5018]
MPSILENQKSLVATMLKQEETWDLSAIFALRTPDFTHNLLPADIGGPSRNQDESRQLYETLKPFWKTYKVTKHAEIHDVDEHKAALHTFSSAETTVGHFEMETMWFLTFNEDGTKIKVLTELVDSRSVAELFVKIEAQKKESAA